MGLSVSVYSMPNCMYMHGSMWVCMGARSVAWESHVPCKCRSMFGCAKIEQSFAMCIITKDRVCLCVQIRATSIKIYIFMKSIYNMIYRIYAYVNLHTMYTECLVCLFVRIYV